MISSKHGGNPWAMIEERSLDPTQVLDFSADLNPLGPPPHLDALLKESCPQVVFYPEPSYREFRNAVAQYTGIDASHILPGNGTADLIHLISRTRPRSRAVVLVPTFTEYERAVEADGGEVIPWRSEEENNGAPVSGSLNGSLPLDNVRTLYLCNPNNPTGQLWSQEEVLRCAARCEERGILFVVDEAYMDLVEEPGRFSVFSEVPRFRHLMVLRSLTKSFAVPGLRVGFLGASRLMIQELQRFQPPWVMNALAAQAGAWLVQQEEYLEHSRRTLKSLRESLWEGLRSLSGLSPVASAANFFLCRMTEGGWSNQRLAQKCARHGILIRTCDDFTGLEKGRFIRVAVRRAPENSRLLETLREILHRAG